MARSKVKLTFIINAAARKASYKKRKKGIMKKIEELCTLCGVEACAIIYSEFDPQSEVWPAPSDVQRMLSKFREYPLLEQCKKMLNQETYIKQRLNKAQEQLEKVRKENREKEMSMLMYQYLTEGKILDTLTMVDLNDLAWLISDKQIKINHMLRELNKNLGSTSQTQPKQEDDEVEQVAAQIVAYGPTNQGDDHGKRVVDNHMDATQDVA